MLRTPSRKALLPYGRAFFSVARAAVDSTWAAADSARAAALCAALYGADPAYGIKPKVGLTL